MLMLKVACLIVTGIASGLVTATGLFALISSIGLINRYADVTNTKEHILLYEEMIIAGAGAFLCIYMWGVIKAYRILLGGTGHRKGGVGK